METLVHAVQFVTLRKKLISPVFIGFCGFMSILSSMRYCLGQPDHHGNIWAALVFMPFGLFFDFMDGKVARWRHKSSLMGQELDSLADLVRIAALFITFLLCTPVELFLRFQQRPLEAIFASDFESTF